MENNLNFLPVNTARLLSSGQIITSVSSVVKELLENALDAGATSLTVKLENFGLDTIEVKDDGHGVSYDNVQNMFKPGYTSKICHFKDLESLYTYGFRGEALAAIAKLSEVTITTKTDKDQLAMTYTINSCGVPTSSAPNALQKGTIITVGNLFNTLPVRKQYLSSKRRMTEELKKAEVAISNLAVIHPQIRVVLMHNKNVVWQKNSVDTLKKSFMQLIGLRHVAKLEFLEEDAENIKLEMLVPKKEIGDIEVAFPNVSTSYVFINKRSVTCKEITKIVDDAANTYWKTTDRHILHLISLTVPPDQIDVNLEPNKTKVLLRNLTQVLTEISKALGKYYGCRLEDVPADEEEEEVASKKARYEDLEEDNEIFSQIDESVLNQSNDSVVPDNILRESTVPRLQTLSAQINEGNNVLTSKEIDSATENLGCSTQELFQKTLAGFTLSKKKPELSISDWSRGKAMVNGQILQPGVNVTKENIVTPKKAENIRIEKEKPPLEQVRDQPSENTSNLEVTFATPTVRRDTMQISSLNTSYQNQSPLQVNNASREAIFPQSPFFDNTSHLEQAYNSSTVVDESTTCQLEEPVIGGRVHFDPAKEDLGLRDVINVPSGGTLSQNPFRTQKIAEAGVESVPGENLTQNPFRTQASGLSAVITDVKEENSMNFDSDVAVFDLSGQSVSSQLGKKQHSAFTKFAGIERPKIIKENPGIDFTKVSKILMERWRDLTSDEQQYYETVAKAVDQGRKEHQQQKLKLVTTAAKPKPKVESPLKRKRPERKEIPHDISLPKLAVIRKSAERIPVTDSGISAIGWIVGDLICRQRSEFGFCRMKCLFGEDSTLTKKPTTELTMMLRKTATECCQHGKPAFFPFNRVSASPSQQIQ